MGEKMKTAWRTITYPLIGGSIMVLMVLGLLMLDSIGSEPQITAEIIHVSTENTIAMPHSYQALPDGPEGSIVLNIKPPVEVFQQFSDVRDYILFFSSTAGPTVEVLYDIHTKNFITGQPQMKSPSVDIFDGNTHMLAYTYKQDGMQRLYFDGNLVNETQYHPKDPLAAMAISAPVNLELMDGYTMEVELYNYEIEVN